MTHHDDSDTVRVSGESRRPKVPDSVIIEDDDVKIDGVSVPWYLAADGPRFERREGVEAVVWLPVLVFTDTTTVGIHSRRVQVT